MPTLGHRSRLHNRAERLTAGVPQPQWRRLVNPFRPLELLSADQVEAIHQASLRILRDVGVEVLGARALDLLTGAGARVERFGAAAGRVRLDPGHLEALVALAPARFDVRARNPERDLVFGERHLVIASVGGPAFVSDLDRGRRPGTLADFEAFVRIVGALNVIHQEGGGPLEPLDLPAATRHLDMYRVLATVLDKPWQCLGSGRAVVDDALDVACLALGVTRDELARRPALMTVINTNSPLRLDGPMSDGLIAMAAAGQPVVVTPFTLAGAMAPVTLAGALAQQNAEALFMVALTQLARSGAPVVYGGFTSNVDLRSGAPAFGTPEYVQAAIATGQLARRHGLPHRSSNVTASACVDAQAAYESSMSIWGSVMAGASLLYQGAGWLEGGLVASFEKLVLDAELLAQMGAILTPPVVDEATLAVSTVADVGPGGHFFGTPHTLERYEDAFYAPMLSDWRSFEAWREDGGRTATERANRLWKELLAASPASTIEPGAAEAIDEFVARRKREIDASIGG